MKNSYDAIVIGMGPSGIFLAYELIQLKKAKNILLIDQGKRVEDRNCPLEKVGKCVKCKPFCSITCGFSGAGAFSDGKLSLYNDEDDDIYVGGILHEYIGVENTKRLIDYTDEIYLKFGADKKLEGVDFKEQVSKIKEKSTKQGINLINIPIRHLGTEKAHKLYKKLEDYLIDNGINMMFETEVKDLIIEDNKVKGAKIVTNNGRKEDEVYSDNVVIAVGRKGANWLSDMCDKHSIDTRAGVVDIGIRYELPDEIMKENLLVDHIHLKIR